MSNYSDKYVITTGEPNGIGAEITIKALNYLKLPKEKVVVVSNKGILAQNGSLDIDYEIMEVPYDGNVNAGIDTKEGGEFSFQSLRLACEMKPKAIITAPVSKNAMHLAGHFFNGQTEVLEYFLAKNSQRAEMLFVCEDFRVLLLTRHVPLSAVNLSSEEIVAKILRLDEFFKTKTSVQTPKIAVCALNPHAGENGVIGREELDVINPALLQLRLQGVDVTDAISADILMSDALRTYLNNGKMKYDCYVAMYHDQGLIPIKAAGLENVVNMTIGLDIVRTSPSHGTAYDIAGKFIASEMPMVSAIQQALNI